MAALNGYEYCKNSRLIKKNKFLQQSQSGRCYILGSGPSLKNVDFNELQGKNVFCVNTLNKDSRLPPEMVKFWTIYDLFYYPVTRKGLDIARELDQFLQAGVKLFLPVQAKELVDKYSLFQDKEVVYLLFSKGTVDLLDYEQHVDLTNNIMHPHNIIEIAIICAMYMGFDEIVLLGCDSNWFMYDAKKADHSYEVQLDYLEKGEVIQKNESAAELFTMETMEDKLMYGYLLFRNYRFLNDVAKKKGVKIFDCTEGGKLDMFIKDTLACHL